MITILVIVNFLVAFINFYLAWRIHGIRQRMIQITAMLIQLYQVTPPILASIPREMGEIDDAIATLRKRYQTIQLRRQQIKQVIMVINFLIRLWRSIQGNFLPKSVSKGLD